MATEKAKAEAEAAPAGPQRQRRTADKLIVATPGAAQPGQESATPPLLRSVAEARFATVRKDAVVFGREGAVTVRNHAR